MEDYKNSNSDETFQSVDEIDFNKLLNILLRRKVFIISFSLIAAFASIGFSFLQKNIWRGEFQIVVEEKESETNPLEGNAFKLLKF